MFARYFSAILVCFCKAFSIEAATYAPLEIVVPGLTNTVATGLNHNGWMVGYGSGSSGTVSFLRINSFSTLSYPGATSTKAMGINDGGDIVGTYSTGPGASHGFKYSGGSYTTIDAPSPALPNTTNLTGINSGGQIVGYASMTGGGIDSFADNSGSFTFLPFTDGEQVVMTGVNDSGEMVGVYQSANLSSSNPIYGTTSGYTKVQGQPPDAVLRAVNQFGHVILTTHGVSYLYSSATLASQELISSITFPGSQSTTGWGLSSSDTAVGQFVDGQGNTHAFSATIGFLPSCVVTGNSGPPRQFTFTFQDNDFGLKQITQFDTVNANVNIPSFTAGTTAPVLVTATVTDPSQPAKVITAASNTNNNENVCFSTFSPRPAVWAPFPGRLIGNITPLASAYQDSNIFTLFGLGTDGALWLNEGSSGASFEQWQRITSAPVPLSGDPTILTPPKANPQALVTDANGQLWYSTGEFQSFPWQAWQNIASGVTGKAAGVLDISGIPNAFIRSTDGSVVSLVENNPSVWSAGALVGGTIISDPVALLDSSGNIQLYAIGTDNALWNSAIRPDGTVIPWSSTGGSLKGNPTVIASAGTLYAFSRGTDDSLWFSTQPSGGSWTSWQSLGGILSNNPRATVNSDGRVEVFVAGYDSSVWHLSQISAGSAQWSDWSGLGGVIVGDVTPFVDVRGILNLFVLGSDRSVWQMTQPLADNWQ